MSGRVWTGHMPSRYLRDGMIDPTEYRCWRDAHHHFDRHPGERAKMGGLMYEIDQEGGVTEPLLIGVSDQDHRVYVGDGHHRAVAIRVLGEPWFPFKWYWIKSMGVRIECTPFPLELLRGAP